ncbi:MAG: hypothetical protein HZA89_09480, partial [Verrucomicrobia bacterium]|nr:hypothetical protein [Verrucomicrobiota bacterium]
MTTETRAPATFAGVARSKLLPGWLLCALLLGAGLLPARAQFKFTLTSSPRNDYLIPNGQVNAILEHSNVVYIGGAFSQVATNTGHGMFINASNGAPLGVPPRFERDVFDAVPDGAGGWFVAGDFQTVDNTPKFRLAHILPDRTLDPNFSADFDNSVNSIILAGTNLYVGGAFTRITNVVSLTNSVVTNRFRFAVLNPQTGAPRSLPSNPSFDNAVQVLLLDGDTMFVGGTFIRATNILTGLATNVLNRRRTASFRLSTGQVTPFQADVDAVVVTMAIQGPTLFMGGVFTNVTNSGITTDSGGNYRPRRGFAAVDRNTGIPLTNFWVDFNNNVRAIAVGSNGIYIGGEFTGASAVVRRAYDPTSGTYTNEIQNRTRLVALDLPSGNINPFWTPQADGTVFTLLIQGSNVYAGGAFNNIREDSVGGGNRALNKLAAISRSLTRNSTVSSIFDADVGDTVNAIAFDGTNTCFIGGVFQFTKGVVRNRLAAFNATTGQLLPWNPNANNTVRAMARVGTNLFVGGDFVQFGQGVNASPRVRFAALDLTLGAVVAKYTNGFPAVVRAMASNGTNLFIGGDFTQVTNRGVALTPARNYLASMDITTGDMTNFNATLGQTNAIYASSNVTCLAISGTNLYVGGLFTGAGGQPRRGLAAVNIRNGALNPNWRCDVNTSNVLALAVSGSSLIVGGQFLRMTNYVGTNPVTFTRNRIGAVGLNDGSVNLTWNPNSPQHVMALATRGTNLYVGGQFGGAIGGQTRNRLAEISTVNGLSTPWNPDADNIVWSLHATTNRVYAGGVFTVMGVASNVQSILDFAVFDSTNSVPVLVMNTNAILYDEAAPLVPIDGALRVSDANHVAFTNAIITVSNYFAAEDSFSITSSYGVRVTSAVTSNFLTITLSGRAGIPAYQQMLRTLAYTNTSLSPTQSVRTVRITVADPFGDVSLPVARPISVRPLNTTPTLAPLTNIVQTVGQPTNRTVQLTGISTGGDSNQVLNASAFSTDNSIAQPLIVYAPNSTNSTGSLLFTNLTRVGTATISVVIRDSGGTANGSIDSVTNTFFIRIVASNSPPVMDALPSLTVIQQDTGPYTNFLSNIDVGGSGLLTITATSGNPALMPDPTVIYHAPDTTGMIVFAPTARANGTVTNTVLLRNGGLTNNSFTNQFAVTVLSNVVPTLDPIADVRTNVSAAVVAVPMTGITAGAGANQVITIKSDTSVVEAFRTKLSSFTNFFFTAGYSTTNVAITNFYATNLTFTNVVGTNSVVTNVAVTHVSVTNISGTNVTTASFFRTNFAVAMVEGTNTVVSNLSLTNFTATNTIVSNFSLTNVAVTVVTTNLVDTNTVATNITVTREAVSGVVAQTEVSVDTISGVNVVYASPNTNGTIFLTPAPGVVGTGVVSVVVRDNGGIANGGRDAITNTFRVSLAPNLTPTLDPIPNIVTNTSPGPQYVILTGITAGPGESQQLTVTATSDNPTFINPVVTYSSPDNFAFVDITPPTGVVSTATITIVVQDNGGTAGGAVDAVTNTFTYTTLTNTAPYFDIAAYNPLTDVPYFINPTNLIVAQNALTNLWLSNIVQGIVRPGNTNLGQTLVFELSSSNPNLVTPIAIYLSANPTGIVAITPRPNASGSTLLTLTLRDNGGTTNGGVDGFTRTFTMTVLNTIADFPRNDFPLANGPVHTLLETNGFLYLGGGFTELGTNTGKAVPVNATNGDPLVGFPKFDRDVNVIIPDSTNGWYVGGTFLNISGVPRLRLARLLRDFSVDVNFTADFDSTVSALALRGGELYVGGAFVRVTNYVGGVRTVTGRSRYAVLDRFTGAPSRPADPVFNNTVNAIAPGPLNRIYVGGTFTLVTTATATNALFRLAALDAAGGILPGFQADADAGTVRALSVSSDGQTLFAGGDFTRITNGGTTFPRFRLAGLNIGANGAPGAFQSDMSAPVRAPWFLTNANPPRLVAGGDFTVVTGRNLTLNSGRIASLDAVLGDPSTVWTPGVDGSVNALWQDGASDYVGGAFTSVTNVLGGGATARRRAVALSTNQAATAVVQAWNPAPAAAVNALAANRGTAYVGGVFNFTRGVARNRLAAIETATGQITPWNPNANNTVLALATAYLGGATNGSNVLYAGGQFTTVSGGPGLRLVMLNTNVYETNATNPLVISTFTNGSGDVLFTNGFSGTIRALAVGPTNLYVGGDFTNYRSARASGLTNITNTAVRFGLAAVNLTNGELRANFIANARPTGASNVLTLLLSGTNLYAGGTFLNITNPTPTLTTFNKARLAKLNPDTGRPLTTFTNNFDAPVAALYLNGTNQLLVGGSFNRSTNLTGRTNTHLAYALLEPATGYDRIASVWFDIWFRPNGRISALAVIGTNFYAGGAFTNLLNSDDPINDNNFLRPRNRLAEVTLPDFPLGGTIDSRATAWNPDMDNEVYTLLARGGRLYAGGPFTASGSGSALRARPIQGLAVFDTNVAPVVIPSPVPTLFTVGDPPVPVDPGLQIRDANSALLVSATVRITNNYFFGEDVLGYQAVPNGITGVFDPTNATLTLTGVAPVETWQNALRAVTYNNTLGPAPTRLIRAVEFTVDDGQGLLGSARQNVNVVTVNGAPTLDPIPNLTLLEDALTNLVLTGISAGSRDGVSDTNVISIRLETGNTNLYLPTNTVVTTNGLVVTTNTYVMLTYASPDGTALLNLTPLTNAAGTATLTVIVSDDGGTSYGGVNAVTNTFSVVVNPLNDPPTISGPTSTVYLNEHTNPVPLVYSIGLSNITVGPPNEQNVQTLITFTAASSDSGLIPNPEIVFANANGITTGTLKLTVAPNQQGSTNPPVVFTMILRDNGGTNSGGVDSVTNTFLVVIGTNFPPTLDPIASFATNASPGLVTVPLTGISGGGGVIEPVFFTASYTSSVPGLVLSNLLVSPATNLGSSTGLLSFTPAETEFGTATVTVIARDSSGSFTVGGTNYGVDAVTNTFVVTIRTNAVPTLAPIANIRTNASPGTMALTLSGITMGAGEGGQFISISARTISNVFNTNFFGTNLGIFSTNVLTNISDVVVTNVTFTTNLVTTTNANGSTNFEAVTITANYAAVTNQVTNSIAVTNFIVAAFLDTNYTSPGSNAVLYLTPIPGLVATSTVEVVVRDNGGTLGGGRDAVTNTFTVATTGNNPPTLTLETNVFTTISTGPAITNTVRVPEDPGLLIVELSGITTGEPPGDNSDGQSLIVVATSSAPALISPVVEYVSPNTTGAINITPARNASGTAVITVTVVDDGDNPKGSGPGTFTTNFLVVVDAGVADLPRHNFIVPNGPVQALVATNNTLYFGGGFTEVGTNRGRAVPVDTTTGDLLSGFPLIERGVNAVIADGQGGWYLGGDFVTVGGASRQRIVHLTSTLTVDPVFTPDFNGTVNALLLSGTNLFVGGAFTAITNYVNTTFTNFTTNFTTNFVVVTNLITFTNSVSTNLEVVATNTVALTNVTFTTTNFPSLTVVTNRFRFAALDPATGLPRSFINPVGTNRFANNPAFNNSVLALGILTNGNSLFFGGTFTSITNVNVSATLTNLVTNSRVRLAKMDLFNGRIENNFAADADAAVRALAIDEQPGIGSTVYAGGDFVRITNGPNILPRTRLAALNSTLGSQESTRPWSNGFNAAIHALLLVETNLVIGGDFTVVTSGAGAAPRQRLVVLDTTAAVTGGVHAVNLAWSNNVNGSVRALAMDVPSNAAPANTLYLGGLFTAVNDVPRRRAAALDADFTVDTTNAPPIVQAFDPAMSGPVLAVAVSGPRAYLGGTFSFVRGAFRSRLAAVDLARNELLPWNPDVNGSVLTLALNNGNVYAGGQFTLVTNILFGATNVTAPARLAVFNPSNGLVIQSFSNAFNNTVRALAFGGGNLYVGGDFTLVTNNSVANVRSGLAAVNAINGAISTNFVLHARSTVASNVLALSYVPSAYFGDRLYVGGAFVALGADATNTGTAVTVSGGAPRLRLASVSIDENGIDFGFNCNLNGAVTALIGSETNVYVAGEFTFSTNSSGNSLVNRLFAADSLTGDPYVIGFDEETGLPLFWAPNANNRVNAISSVPGSTNIYAGGIFTVLGGTNRLRLAELDKSIETNNASLWAPAPDSDVFAVLATPSRVIVGGAFNVIGPLPVQGLAVFERNVSTIVQTTPSPLTYTASVVPPLALAVDAGVRLIDPNVAFITNALLRFETNALPNGPIYIPGEDVLVFNTTNGITGQFYPTEVPATLDAPGISAGSLVLSGSGTVDQYQDALRSVIYVNTNSLTTNRLRQVSFLVNDGSAKRDINVVFTNAPPSFDLVFTTNLNASVPYPVVVFTGTNVVGGGGGVVSISVTNIIVYEDSGYVTLQLSNVIAGGGLSQFLTVSAEAADGFLFPTLDFNYTWPATTGTLRFATLTNFPFTTNPYSSVVSVIVRDDGGTFNGGVDAFTNTFTLTVLPVNDAPTLQPIASLTIIEDNGGAPLVIPLDQIRVGGSELQFITVTAASSNAGLIPNLPGNLAVSYNYPDSTGRLTIVPAANQRGTTTITVTVADDGGTSRSADVDRISRTFTIAVVDQNDAPTMTPLPDLTILEDSGPTNFSLLNITPGGGTNEAGQALTVTAFVSGVSVPAFVTNSSGVLNTNVIAPPLLAYTNSTGTNYPNAGTLTITPLTNAFGTVTITVLVKDDAGTLNGGVDTRTNTFRLTITNVNDAPTLNPLTNLVLAISPPLQLVPLSGIAAGPPNEITQNFTFSRSVVAAPSALLATAGVTNSYQYPNSTGLLSFRPAASLSGTATITVTAGDFGGSANGGTNSISRSFTVTVRPTNSQPTFTLESNAVTIVEDAGVQVMNLTNVTAGLETQPLTMSVLSSDTNLVRIVATNYTSPNANGQIAYASRTNANGTATITVILRDNGGTTAGGVDAFTNTFTVTVLPVNDAPTLGVITNLAFFPSPGPQTVLVTNIAPGGGPDEAGQGLTLTATVIASSNPALIPATPVTSVSPNSTGQISFTPAAGEQGTATIAVVAQDSGATGNGGVDATTNTFLVQISANAPPTMDLIANLTLAEDPGQIVIPLTGISAGPYNEAGQVLTITADVVTAILPRPVLFAEDFESGLGRWTGKNGGTNQAVVVNDPLGTRGKVLTFTGTNDGGDLFTTNVFSTFYSIEISFDYLGLSQVGSVADDFGGMVGVSPGLDAGGETWIAATSDAFPGAFQLLDDGQWHRVTVNLEGTNVGAFHLKLQDWLGSGGVAGDALFDNIVVQGYTNSTTPVISSNLLTLIYTNGQSTGQLSFTPAEEASGTATITLTLRDDGGTPPGGIDTLIRTFTVTVLASNDPPTMNLFTNLTLLEDDGAQTLLLDGITTGGSLDERYQTLTLTFSNSNPGLLPELTNFVITNFTGTVGTSMELAFTPAPNQSGTAAITILLRDNGGTVNGSFDSLTNTFVITVLEVNDAPTLSFPPDLTILEDAGTQFVP